MPKRQWTVEQRAAARARAQASWAERKVSTAVMSAAPELDQDDDDVLAQLATTILKARDKKQKQSKVLEELGAILDQIDPTDHPELADNDVVQSFVEKIGAARLKKAEKEGLPPGSIIGTGIAQQSVPWKLDDVNRRADGSKELVTWTPNETIPIFYNGVMCQAIADVEMTTEKAFKDIYDERRKLLREADVRKQWMFGKTNQRPPESDEAAVSMARVRAFMGMGGEGGGGRILMGYPGDARFELREMVGGTGGEQSGKTSTT